MTRWKLAGLVGAVALVLAFSWTYWSTPRSKSESQQASLTAAPTPGGLSASRGGGLESSDHTSPVATPEQPTSQLAAPPPVAAAAVEQVPAKRTPAQPTSQKAPTRKLAVYASKAKEVTTRSARRTEKAEPPEKKVEPPEEKASPEEEPSTPESPKEQVVAEAEQPNAKPPEPVIPPPPAKTAKVVGFFRNEVGPAYRLVSLTYLLDGEVAFRQTGSQTQGKLFEQQVTPGAHTTSAVIEYQGEGGSIFSYVRGYRFNVHGGKRILARNEEATQVTFTMSDEGGPTTPFEERLRLRVLER